MVALKLKHRDLATEEPKASPEKPSVGEKPPAEAAKKKSYWNSAFNDWIIILTCLCALAGGLWWGLYQMERQERAVSGDLSLNSQASRPTPLPSLKLNNQHQRLGEPIVINPAEIGKSNPFALP